MLCFPLISLLISHSLVSYSCCWGPYDSSGFNYVSYNTLRKKKLLPEAHSSQESPLLHTPEWEPSLFLEVNYIGLDKYTIRVGTQGKPQTDRQTQ